jgi:hypothetical protein
LYVLIIRSNYFAQTCFGIYLPSSGGREYLISYSSDALCYGRVRIMIRPVWPVVVPKHVEVKHLERINETATTSLRICWSFCKRYYKMLSSTIKNFLVCPFVFCFWCDNPHPPLITPFHQWAKATSFTKFLDHTKRRTTRGRTPVIE